MRDWKFRAWNKSGRRWEYFTLTELALGAMYTKVKGTNALVCHWDNYERWEQSTGLTDKGGKEIFEGDILKWQSRYSCGKCGHCETYQDKVHLGALGATVMGYRLIDPQHSDMLESSEIIGDIHTTPGLMEAQDGRD